MKKHLWIFSLLFFCASFVTAQRTVTGMIIDEDNEPLIGATVLAEGTSVGTVTDIEGKYSLKVPEGATTLTYSYTGFATKTMAIGASNVMDVTMSIDAVGLEDIVVIGYGAQKRKDVTGAVSSVNTKDIENVQLPSFETALQGRAAGVTVTKNSGKPGGGIDVNIRGRTSITASNQPLYVIDGVPLISGDNVDFSQEAIGGSNISVLSDLNPEDIESIEVLKDAASAAIYGSRAANGVVLITTKKGTKDGVARIGLNASYGNQWLPKKINTITGQEYQDYSVELWGPLLDAIGVERSWQSIQDNILGPVGDASTDWQDEIFTNGALRKISANVSGGNQNTQYYGSIGYSGEEGIMKNSGFERYSGRLNLTQKASERLNLGMNLSYALSKTDQIQNDNNIFGALGASILIPPVVPIFNEDGSYGGAFGIENAVAAVTEYDNTITRGRLIGSVNAGFKLFDGFSVNARVGVDLFDQVEDIYEPSVLQSSNTGRAVYATAVDRRFIHEYFLKYDKVVGGGDLQVVGGTSFQQDDIKLSFTEAVDFPTDEFTGLTSGASPLTTNGSQTGDNLKSFFGSVNYNYKGKYYLTGTFRADGSSRFVNNQWGYFPGVSAAWSVADDLFPSSNVLSQLKLRVGWGQTGNNNIGNFLAQQLFGGGANYLDAPGIVPTQLGNPDLKWETTTQTNIGLDFGIVNDRVTGSIDFYIKNTDDLLLNRPIPTTSGFATVIQNIGEVKNTGVDLSLTTRNIEKSGFNWSTTFTVAYLENEVVKLVDGIPFDSGFANRVAEGQPLGVFFGRQVVGIFQNQAEIDAAPTQPSAAPGDLQFADISGGAGPDNILGTADDLPPDGIINDNDRTYIGKALPDFTGGIMNNLSYKGFDLNFFFQFAVGNDVYNNNLAFAEGMNSVFAPTKRAWDNRWQEEGDQTDIPRLIRNDPNGNRQDSERFVESGDYIRLKTLTLGYQVPKRLLDEIGIASLKVYVSGYNLWTLTGYSWYDPEVNIFDGGSAAGNNTSLGTDFLTFPQARSLTFGVNLGF